MPLCSIGRFPPTSRGCNNNQPERLKTSRLWVTGGCFAARRGHSWQAAVTVVLLPHKLLLLVKRQATPQWSLIYAPYSHHLSIHPLIFLTRLFPSFFCHRMQAFFSHIPFYDSFLFSFICSPTFQFPLILSLFCLHLQSFPNFLPSFVCATSPFIESLERVPEGFD